MATKSDSKDTFESAEEPETLVARRMADESFARIQHSDYNYTVFPIGMDNDGLESTTEKFSLLKEDFNPSTMESNQFKLQIKQLHLDLQAEQDNVIHMRKRMNDIEKDRLETTSRANAEIASLESQVTKLRSQVEKGEADRQNLEVELSKAKRDVTQYRHMSSDRENVLAESNKEMKQKIKELSEEAGKLHQDVQFTRQNALDIERKIRQELDEKEQQLAQCQTDYQIANADKNKMNALVSQQESAINELSEKFKKLDDGRRNDIDELHRATSEVQFTKERELTLKRELDTALHKIRALEESIETERAAHLETKFNSEIIQLRFRDIEGGLDVEKSANAESSKAVERLTKQLQEIEQAYEDERKSAKQTSHKLEKIQKEYNSVKKQLTTEVDDKKSIINNMCKELEVHQKSFNELKDELGKAKKRQNFLEENYGGSIKELEIIIKSFQLEDKPKRTRLKKEAKPQTPAAVVEDLNTLLEEYKKKIGTMSSELTKMKKLNEKLSKEIDNNKEMIRAKDKSLEDLQRNYTKTAKELNRVRADYSELETSIARLKVDLQSTSSNQSKDKQRIHELSTEIMKLTKHYKTDTEEKMSYLHGLYQRLLAGRIVVSNKEKNQFSWAELTTMVFQQVSEIVNNLQRTGEKVKGLEEAYSNKESAMEEMQKSYEEQLNKLTLLTKEREKSWQKQKEELEEHYTQLVNDLQSRTKKSQVMADQAWEKIRTTGNVQHGLETECSGLRTHLNTCQKQNGALLAACSLLAGALYPLISRANQLAMERKILEELTVQSDVCRDRAQILVSTLSSEMKTDSDNSEKVPHSPKRRYILTFRIGVVAVLALNRLRFLAKGTCSLFKSCTSVSDQNGLVVCTGGVKPIPKSFLGMNLHSEKSLDDEQEERPGEEGLVQWVKNTDLLEGVVASMSDLVDITKQVEDTENKRTIENRTVVKVAQNCFNKLLDRLSRQFDYIELEPVMATRGRNSLVRLLGRGLTKILQNLPTEEKGGLVSQQDLMMALQNHILDFTQRLHTVEVDRRQVLLELGNLKKDITGDNSEDGVRFISRDKFENVCLELNNALNREQQLQELLTEQSRQLEDMSSKMDLFTTEGMAKETNLSSVMKNLSDVNKELKKKEQTIRQLNKQVHQAESDKKSYQENLFDAENALRTVVRDREILSKYISAVENALQQVKHQIAISKDVKGEVSLSHLLLSADFIPKDIGKVGPELIACQNLVGAFIDAQNQCIAKIKGYEEEILSHRKHITSLKKELSDAVRRESEEPVVSNGIPGRHPTMGSAFKSLSEHSITDTDGFEPLREDSEISYTLVKVASPKHKVQQADRKSDRSFERIYYYSPSKQERQHRNYPHVLTYLQSM